MRTTIRWALVVAAAVAGGCGSKPPPPVPFVATAVRGGVRCYSGTVVSGPTTRPVPATAPADALDVTVTLSVAEKPLPGGQPIGSVARSFSAASAGSPVRATAQLTRPARVVVGGPEGATADVAAAGQSIPVVTGRVALAVGMTAEFIARDPSAATDALFDRGVTVYVSRRPDAVADADGKLPVVVALAVADRAPDTTTDAPDDPNALKDGPATQPAARPAFWQREIAVLDRRVGEQDALVFSLPFRFGGDPGRAVVAWVAVRRGSADPGHLAAVAETAERVRKSVEQQSAAANPAADTGVSAGVRAAVAALDRPAQARQTLVYLAGSNGAKLCEDAALVADDASLAALSAAARQRFATGAAATDPAAVGWQLDVAALGVLGDLQSNGKLPPELAAVLTRHCGEVGRNAAKVEELGTNLVGRADLDSRLLAENFAYLDDTSPSARVRAYDWLAARGRAPAGYDPLGPPRERRLALDAVNAADIAGPAPVTTTPAAQGGRP